MRLLVTGAGGLLGSNIVEAAQLSDISVIATYHTQNPDVEVPCVQFDITDPTQLEASFSTHEPDVVINCAAMTDVDACEETPEQSREVNGAAPGKLAEIAADREVNFVQISTDYVFDGRSDEPYEPDDATNPIQEYGRTKLLGETRVRDRHPSPLIARLSFVYGRSLTGPLEGFPGWVLGRLRDNEETPLFTDQHITPTRAGAAAETILEFCQKGSTGTFHVAAKDCVTPYEFGRELADLTGEPLTLLTKGRMADVERPAKRPKNTCLSVARTEAELERPQPTLKEDLEALL
jgi:dTDP-4-dehydrorhamnose reductase